MSFTAEGPLARLSAAVHCLCIPTPALPSLPRNLPATIRIHQQYRLRWPRQGAATSRTSEVKDSAPAPVGLMTRSKCTSSPSAASNTSLTDPLRGLQAAVVVQR